jgi:hypothetical protein
MLQTRIAPLQPLLDIVDFIWTQQVLGGVYPRLSQQTDLKDVVAMYPNENGNWDSCDVTNFDMVFDHKLCAFDRAGSYEDVRCVARSFTNCVLFIPHAAVLRDCVLRDCTILITNHLEMVCCTLLDTCEIHPTRRGSLTLSRCTGTVLYNGCKTTRIVDSTINKYINENVTHLSLARSYIQETTISATYPRDFMHISIQSGTGMYNKLYIGQGNLYIREAQEWFHETIDEDEEDKEYEIQEWATLKQLNKKEYLLPKKLKGIWFGRLKTKPKCSVCNGEKDKDDIVCYNCRQRKSYSTSNTYEKGKVKKQPTFSIEFELSENPTSLKAFEHLIRLGWIPTNDTTVAVELKSPIFHSLVPFVRLEHHVKALQKYVGTEAGTHIHIGISRVASQFLSVHFICIMNTLEYYMKEEQNRLKLRKYWGRTFVDYASPLKAVVQRPWIRLGQRYETLEWRLPRYQNWNQFVSVLKFVRDATTLIDTRLQTFDTSHPAYSAGHFLRQSQIDRDLGFMELEEKLACDVLNLYKKHVANYEAGGTHNV